MNHVGRIKKYVLIFFLFLAAGLFAEEKPAVSSGEERAISYLRELFFEVTRYNATGLSSLPESAGLSEISKVASGLFLQRTARNSIKNPVYLCEYYFPEKIGVIDSTFCPEDLYATADFFAGNENDGEGEESSEIPEFDWIDLVLQGLDSYQPSDSESYGILDGAKILEMLEKNDSRGIEAQDEAGKSAENLPQEAAYSKNDGSLRRFSYDGEQFTAWKEGENTVLVNFYGDKLIRKTFDPLYRLVKNERFKTGGSAKSMNLETENDFSYSAESTVPLSSVEENFSTKKRLENRYDESGRSVFLLESHYEEQEVKRKSKKKKDAETEKETVLLGDKKTEKKYDEKGRVSEEEITTWTRKTNSFGRNLTEERVVKNVYDYSGVTEENNFPPNVQFFEDGELHLERKYTSSSDYSEKLYFEDGFSVEVFYENGMKKTEIIYMNGAEQRRREFEY